MSACLNCCGDAPNGKDKFLNMDKRRTKIVATVSDRRCDVEFIASLYEAGVNVVRINSAHADIEGATRIVENTRKVSDSIAILIDTKGPEIRTSRVADSGITVSKGDIICVKGGDKEQISSRETIYVTDHAIADDVPVGASILIDDGELELVVISRENDTLVARVENDGIIKSFKSVNVPDVPISLPSITERDEKFIVWAIENDLDFIAHSFVRSSEDVLAVQKIIDKYNSHIKIISKIENQEGVDNIDSILEYTYGVMIARGDLGVEIPSEKIPIIQRTLIKKCVESKKPVIVATQMLQSMISNPRATRAEISDIANAIYQRADAIMLSGETANGQYPVEAVKTMVRVALQVESDTYTIENVNMTSVNNEITAQLARSAVRACLNLPVKAVVIDTLSGRTGRYLSAFRGSKVVYAVCYRKHVMREMALSYGIYPYYHEPLRFHHNFMFNILTQLKNDGKLTGEDLIVVVGGDFGAAKGASFMEIGSVENLISKSAPDQMTKFIEQDNK